MTILELREKRAKAWDACLLYTSSGDARMQPLYFLITTAGTDTRSICYETHQKAKDILEGRKIDQMCIRDRHWRATPSTAASRLPMTVPSRR